MSDGPDLTLNFGPDGFDVDIDPRVTVPDSITSNIVTFPGDDATFYVQMTLHDLRWPFLPAAAQEQMPRGMATMVLINGSIIKELGANVVELEEQYRARRQQG